jgi:hypothetical protein
LRKSLRVAAISDPSFQPSVCASGKAVVVEADNAKKLFDLHLTWQAKGGIGRTGGPDDPHLLLTSPLRPYRNIDPK